GEALRIQLCRPRRHWQAQVGCTYLEGSRRWPSDRPDPPSRSWRTRLLFCVVLRSRTIAEMLKYTAAQDTATMANCIKCSKRMPLKRALTYVLPVQDAYVDIAGLRECVRTPE